MLVSMFEVIERLKLS